jgi:hypothetical protein
MTTPPVFLPVSCKRLQFSLMASSKFEQPNAQAHLLPEAGAERSEA